MTAKRRVFLYWAQGWDQAPDLVKRVRDTWVFHNPTWEVVTLDDSTLSDWIDVPVLNNRPDNLTVQAASDIIRMNLLNRYGGIWADATMMCPRPLTEWVDQALDPEGFWMYHGGPGGRYAALFFLASKPGSLIVSRWKGAIDRFWENPPAEYAYQWVDHLFLNLVRTDPQFSESWNRVPYQWCDRPASAHTFGDYGLCYGPPDEELLQAVQTTVPFALKLNWRGEYHSDTNAARILDWAMQPRRGPAFAWETPPVLDTLQQLFNMYGTDKERHGYHLVYEPLLRDQRYAVQQVLEVGIGTLIPNVPSSMVGYAEPWYAPGGSLQAWRDYFANATVWGLDVQTDIPELGDRIKTRVADSTDAAAVNAVLPSHLTFDLIVDDGLHTFEAQVATLRNLWPRVNPGGFYVIEDLPYTAQHIIDSGILNEDTLARVTVHTDNKLMVIPK